VQLLCVLLVLLGSVFVLYNDFFSSDVPSVSSKKSPGHAVNMSFHGTNAKGEPFTIQSAQTHMVSAQKIISHTMTFSLQNQTPVVARCKEGSYDVDKKMLWLSDHVTVNVGPHFSLVTQKAKIDCSKNFAEATTPVRAHFAPHIWIYSDKASVCGAHHFSFSRHLKILIYPHL
jgi:hypothetical protein